MDQQTINKIQESRRKISAAKNVKGAKKRERYQGEIPSMKIAIRSFCLNCMGGGSDAITGVKECTANSCWLYPYRLGKFDKKCLKEVKAANASSKSK